MKNKTKKIVIFSVISVVIIIIAIAGFLVYKNLFAGVKSSRLEGIESNKLSNEEIKNIESVFSDLEKVNKVKVYTNYKIIKIFLSLTEDIEFNVLKEKSNNALSKISESNLKFYDVEIFIESNNEDSSIYPKIGYKHKSNSEFSW